MDQAETSNLPVDAAAIQAKLKQQADELKKKIGGGASDKIRLTKDKKFVLPNGVSSAGPLKGVIIDFVAFNAYYDRPFSEKDKTPPACFALGNVKPVELVPSSASPQKQNDKCGVSKGPGCCWANEFGTKGGGKACGNHYLLGFVEDSDKPNAELYTIQLGPKTLKHWEKYVSSIALQHSMPPIGVVTEIYFDPDEENQVLRFNKDRVNPNLPVHYARQELVLKRLLTEPDVSTYTPPPAQGSKKR